MWDIYLGEIEINVEIVCADFEKQFSKFVSERQKETVFVFIGFQIKYLQGENRICKVSFCAYAIFLHCKVHRFNTFEI